MTDFSTDPERVEGPRRPQGPAWPWDTDMMGADNPRPVEPKRVPLRDDLFMPILQLEAPFGVDERAQPEVPLPSEAREVQRRQRDTPPAATQPDSEPTEPERRSTKFLKGVASQVGAIARDVIAAQQERMKEAYREAYPKDTDAKLQPAGEQALERPQGRSTVPRPSEVPARRVPETPREVPEVERETKLGPDLGDVVVDSQKLNVIAKDSDVVEKALQDAVEPRVEKLKEMEGPQGIMMVDFATGPESRLVRDAKPQDYHVETSAFLDPQGVISRFSEEEFDQSVAAVVAKRYDDPDVAKYQRIMELARWSADEPASAETAVEQQSDASDSSMPQAEPPIEGALRVPLEKLRDLTALAGGANYDDAYAAGERSRPDYLDHPKEVTLTEYDRLLHKGFNKELHGPEAARRVNEYLAELAPKGQTADYTYLRQRQAQLNAEAERAGANPKITLFNIIPTGSKSKVAATTELMVEMLPGLIEQHTDEGKPPQLILKNVDKAKGDIGPVLELAEEQGIQVIQTMRTVPASMVKHLSGGDGIVGPIYGEDAARMSGVWLTRREDTSGYSEGVTGTLGTNDGTTNSFGVDGGNVDLGTGGNESNTEGSSDSMSASGNRSTTITNDAPMIRPSEAANLPDNSVFLVKRTPRGLRAGVHNLTTQAYLGAWPPRPEQMTRAENIINAADARVRARRGNFTDPPTARPSPREAMQQSLRHPIGSIRQSRQELVRLFWQKNSGRNPSEAQLQSICANDFVRAANSGLRITPEEWSRQYQTNIMGRVQNINGMWVICD